MPLPLPLRCALDNYTTFLLPLTAKNSITRVLLCLTVLLVVSPVITSVHDNKVNNYLTLSYIYDLDLHIDLGPSTFLPTPRRAATPSNDMTRTYYSRPRENLGLGVISKCEGFGTTVISLTVAIQQSVAPKEFPST